MPELNLYQKLVAVRKAIPNLVKDGESKAGERFEYVSSSLVLNTIRQELNKQGILLVLDVIDYEVRDHTTKSGTSWYFTVIKIKYTWVNADKPTETIEWHLIGQGHDSG